MRLSECKESVLSFAEREHHRGVIPNHTAKVR